MAALARCLDGAKATERRLKSRKCAASDLRDSGLKSGSINRFDGLNQRFRLAVAGMGH
jgi:hypothetical protein